MCAGTSNQGALVPFTSGVVLLFARYASFFVLIATLSACGGEDVVMPDLAGKRLDIALSDLDRAGYGDEPEVLGGGMFGVVDESNWTICDQEPAPGDIVSTTPRLTVDRTCDGLDKLAPEPDGVEQTDTVEPTESARQREPKPKSKKPVGAETFTMPALVGGNLQEAQDLLQSLGSYLLTQNDATGQGRFQVLDSGWKVCAQIPVAGTVTSVAKMIDLRVVKLDESCP